MSDPFAGVFDAPFAPATRATAVTPDDTTPLADIPKALFIGTGGNLVARGPTGVDATFKNLPSGSVLPFRAQYVRAAGTTAADILALS